MSLFCLRKDLQICSYNIFFVNNGDIKNFVSNPVILKILEHLKNSQNKVKSRILRNCPVEFVKIAYTK